jgi:hypothetical protein
MHPSGSVYWLQDSLGRFPIFVFSADVDSATMGWASFTSTNRRELVICKLTPDEWNDPVAGLDSACHRAHLELGRKDLRPIRLVRVVQPPARAGLSFRHFLSSYRPAQAIYSALDGSGEASVLSQQSAEAFLAQGGLILTHDARAAGAP